MYNIEHYGTLKFLIMVQTSLAFLFVLYDYTISIEIIID